MGEQRQSSGDDGQVRAVAEWLHGRDKIHDLVVAWPPGTKVTSHENTPLMVPAPGIVGVVVSWFENGTVGVDAPMAETLTSPITGHTVKRGQTLRGECDPDKLVFLEYGEWTPDQMRVAVEIAQEIITNA